MKGMSTQSTFDGGNRICHDRKVLNSYLVHQKKLKEITKSSPKSPSANSKSPVKMRRSTSHGGIPLKPISK